MVPVDEAAVAVATAVLPPPLAVLPLPLLVAIRMRQRPASPARRAPVVLVSRQVARPAERLLVAVALRPVRAAPRVSRVSRPEPLVWPVHQF